MLTVSDVLAERETCMCMLICMVQPPPSSKTMNLRRHFLLGAYLRLAAPVSAAVLPGTQRL